MFYANLSLSVSLSPFPLSLDMPLHVRRSSDPTLAGLPLGDPQTAPEEPSRKNPTRWSTTAGFRKHNHHHNHSQNTGTNSLERKGKAVDTCRSLPHDTAAWATQFQRETARSSLSANHPMVDRWLDRQDQATAPSISIHVSLIPTTPAPVRGRSGCMSVFKEHRCLSPLLFSSPVKTSQ
ncbi:unnamed protein product [Coregonus sp. 'balchen']|nr:unnamed protein product [Coregonus sp. 'balchen']